jgi:hypothetical protein
MDKHDKAIGGSVLGVGPGGYLTNANLVRVGVEIDGEIIAWQIGGQPIGGGKRSKECTYVDETHHEHPKNGEGFPCKEAPDSITLTPEQADLNRGRGVNADQRATENGWIHPESCGYIFLIEVCRHA